MCSVLQKDLNCCTFYIAVVSSYYVAHAFIFLCLFQYVGSPVGYVQQIVVKSVVLPWRPQQMIPADAYRAPLSEVFNILHQLEEFQHQSRFERFRVMHLFGIPSF